MRIGLVSNLISCNLFSFENPYKTQAIELFGKDLAESLRNKNHSWKKVMTSWNVLYEACIAIKDSNEYFSITPKQLHCSLQSDNGLVFQMNRRTRHNPSDTEGILITPFGYFNIECTTAKSMDQFINRLEEKFYKKLLQDRFNITKYSFTLFPNKEASIKSSCDIYESRRYACTRSYRRDYA